MMTKSVSVLYCIHVHVRSLTLSNNRQSPYRNVWICLLTCLLTCFPIDSLSGNKMYTTTHNSHKNQISNVKKSTKYQGYKRLNIKLQSINIHVTQAQDAVDNFYFN